MSLASETDGFDKDFPKLELNCGNYLVWREKAEDYIRGQGHHAADTMIEAAWWVSPVVDEGDEGDDPPEDPADIFLNLPTNSETQRQFKVVHQRVFAFLRRKLCDGLFQKTMNMKVKTVPALLRLLRDTWNDGSAIDRGRLRDEMAACRPEQYGSFIEYVTALDQMFATMKSAGISTYDDDEDKLYRLVTSLDDTWKIHKSTATATELSYTDAKAFFQKCAKSDPNISGTSAAASGKSVKSRRSEIYTASEQKQAACWKFAKGECKRGDRCKFSHGNSNSKSFGPSSGHEKQNGAAGGQASQRKCASCKEVIKGPKNWKKCASCFKQAKEQGASASGHKHSANALTQVNEAHSATTARSARGDARMGTLSPETLGGYCYAAEAIQIIPATCVCDSTATTARSARGCVQAQHEFVGIDHPVPCVYGSTATTARSARGCVRTQHGRSVPASTAHSAREAPLHEVHEELLGPPAKTGSPSAPIEGFGRCAPPILPESHLGDSNFISLDPAHAAHTMQQARDGTGPHSGTILVAMDSAATCGVVESEEHCVDIKSVNTTVKVGGDGKPHFVQVRKQGILPIDQFIDGRRVTYRLDVFIIPGFGISIFPLSFLLKRKIKVEFNETLMTATGPDGHIKMQARALHHDRASWLFYAHLRVDGAHVPLLDVKPPTALTATPGCGCTAKSQQNSGKSSAGRALQKRRFRRPKAARRWLKWRWLSMARQCPSPMQFR